MEKIIKLAVFSVLLAAGLFLGRNWLAVYYCNQGSNHYNRGAYQEAAGSFKKSLAINSSVAMVHYNLACAYREINMDEQAIGEYRNTIRIDPKYSRAYTGLSKLYWEDKKHEEALALLKQASAKLPYDQEIEKLSDAISFEYMTYCLDKGIDVFLSGNQKMARDLLNKALEIRPDFAYAHYTLGYFYYAENNYKEAEEALNRALQADSRYWPAYKLLGDICMEKGDYKEAVTKYSVALNLNRESASVNNDLGLALMQMEHYKEAAGYLKEALRLQPGSIDIQCSLANVYKDMGLFGQAASEYEKIILRKPDYPNVHNYLADSYKELGRKDEALAAYQREINISQKKILTSPNSAVTINSLAYAYNGMGNYKEAEGAIHRALALQPGYREAYLTLAKIQENAGNNTEAVASLAKARSLSRETGFIDRDIDRIKKESLQAFKNKASFLPSDIVYLKNGRRLAGVIKSENGKQVVLEAYVGGSSVTTVLPRGEIERIFRSSDTAN